MEAERDALRVGVAGVAAAVGATPLGRTPGRRPLGELDGNATPTGTPGDSAAAGTPLKAWRKAHPRRAALAARAALKGCAQPSAQLVVVSKMLCCISSGASSQPSKELPWRMLAW